MRRGEICAQKEVNDGRCRLSCCFATITEHTPKCNEEHSSKCIPLSLSLYLSLSLPPYIYINIHTHFKKKNADPAKAAQLFSTLIKLHFS